MTRPLTAPGRLVAGRYRLLSEIGGGGMGTVWLARDELLGRQVAVKQVLPPLNADARETERQRERALREGRIAARLSNPHAIAVFDIVVEAEQPWLVMEYLPSRSLAGVLTEDGLLSVDQVAQIGAQVADALAATHAAGIVHRDVKPANILIGAGDRVDGLVKITDFGISHAAGDVTLTQTGQITGTPAFLAPEVAQGEQPRAPSDVFSLGATLYTCLEGTPPFGMTDNALQLLHRVAAGRITAPAHAGALERPLLRMLAADPQRRPTMEQVRDELAGIAAGRDGDPTTVLTTRLRSTAGRVRTAELPPLPPMTPLPDAPPEPSREPSPGPADAAPEETGPEEAPAAGSGRRSRRRVLLLLALLLVVVAVAVPVGLLLTTGGGRGTGQTRGTGSLGTAAATQPTTPPPTTAPSTPAPSTPATATATATAASSSAPSSAATERSTATTAATPAGDVAAFLARYHALLPGDTAAAYALTGPTLRGTESYADYQAFWHQFRAVRLTGIQVQGPTTATGEIDFTYPDGSVQRELHRFTLVHGSGGQLLLDSDHELQVLQSR